MLSAGLFNHSDKWFHIIRIYVKLLIDLTQKVLSNNIWQRFFLIITALRNYLKWFISPAVINSLQFFINNLIESNLINTNTVVFVVFFEGWEHFLNVPKCHVELYRPQLPRSQGQLGQEFKGQSKCDALFLVEKVIFCQSISNDDGA